MLADVVSEAHGVDIELLDEPVSTADIEGGVVTVPRAANSGGVERSDCALHDRPSGLVLGHLEDPDGLIPASGCKDGGDIVVLSGLHPGNGGSAVTETDGLIELDVLLVIVCLGRIPCHLA